MIVKSILYDLIGAKQWSSVSFTDLHPSEFPINPILEYYYELKQSDSFQNGCGKELDSGETVRLHLVETNTLLITVSDSSEFTPIETDRIDSFAERISQDISKSGSREASKNFPNTAGEMLRKPIHLVFLTDEEPHLGNKSAAAVLMLERYIKKYTFAGFGPYNVDLTRISFQSALENSSKITRINPSGVILILGKPIPDESILSTVIQDISEKSDSPLLIAPGSDKELEEARNYEMKYSIDLCDSVSSKPTDLILAVLAMLGFSDMHPEYAKDTWPINTKVDSFKEDEEQTSKLIPVGHQAFYVIDKMTGESVFTYYYAPQEEVNQRVPNVVAAISSFNMGGSEANKTSVVQIGELAYALIEMDNLIFTLVTGPTGNVECLRNQFSFLPDLWKDESPEFLRSTADPYSSPPFTLKLLATLPPEDLPGRLRPICVREPDWAKFESKEVKDFLQAVWSKLDGSITMSQLSSGTGPQMTLGAIHFLKSMKCIQLRLSLDEENIPILTGPVNDDIRRVYSHIDQIAILMDGSHTLKDISTTTKIQIGVLITVISDLYSRGIVTIND